MNTKFDCIIRKFEKTLIIKNYSTCTINNYKSCLYNFLIEINNDPYHLNLEQLNNYLFNFNYSSVSQQNQILNSLKIFYLLILKKSIKHLIKIKRPRREKKLPQVISHDEIVQSISKIQNLKHKAIISLAYSSGLRVSEICNLKLEDIDSKRMLILVKSGKGRKDRVVPLSNHILGLLRKYYLKYKPEFYLFESYAHGVKYSTSSCRQIWNNFKINKNSTFHTLRHSCFTNLLENGTDIRIIQKIAGHSSIKTTEIYTHISTNILNKIKLPI